MIPPTLPCSLPSSLVVAGPPSSSNGLIGGPGVGGLPGSLPSSLPINLPGGLPSSLPITPSPTTSSMSSMMATPDSHLLSSFSLTSEGLPTSLDSLLGGGNSLGGSGGGLSSSGLLGGSLHDMIPLEHKWSMDQPSISNNLHTPTNGTAHGGGGDANPSSSSQGGLSDADTIINQFPDLQENLKFLNHVCEKLCSESVALRSCLASLATKQQQQLKLRQKSLSLQNNILQYHKQKLKEQNNILSEINSISSTFFQKMNNFLSKQNLLESPPPTPNPRASSERVRESRTRSTKQLYSDDDDYQLTASQQKRETKKAAQRLATRTDPIIQQQPPPQHIQKESHHHHVHPHHSMSMHHGDLHDSQGPAPHSDEGHSDDFVENAFLTSNLFSDPETLSFFDDPHHGAKPAFPDFNS